MVKSGNIIYNRAINQEIRFVETGNETNGAFLKMESVYRGPSGKPLEHYHPYQDEVFTVMEGQLSVSLEGKLMTFHPGDRIEIPRNTIHAMWNAIDDITRVSWEVRPALQTAEFLEAVFDAAAKDKSKKGMPPLLLMVVLLRNYSGEFRLSKIPYRLQQVIFALLSPLAHALGYKIAKDR